MKSVKKRAKTMTTSTYIDGFKRNAIAELLGINTFVSFDVQEWAYVYFVRPFRQRPTFVSKKKVNKLAEEKKPSISKPKLSKPHPKIQKDFQLNESIIKKLTSHVRAMFEPETEINANQKDMIAQKIAEHTTTKWYKEAQNPKYIGGAHTLRTDSKKLEMLIFSAEKYIYQELTENILDDWLGL